MTTKVQIRKFVEIIFEYYGNVKIKLKSEFNIEIQQQNALDSF
jgi:hypothetical protein